MPSRYLWERAMITTSGSATLLLGTEIFVPGLLVSAGALDQQYVVKMMRLEVMAVQSLVTGPTGDTPTRYIWGVWKGENGQNPIPDPAISVPAFDGQVDWLAIWSSEVNPIPATNGTQLDFTGGTGEPGNHSSSQTIRVSRRLSNIEAIGISCSIDSSILGAGFANAAFEIRVLVSTLFKPYNPV